jgi:hypothetical protein
MMPGSSSDGPAWQPRDDWPVLRDPARRGEEINAAARRRCGGESQGRMFPPAAAIAPTTRAIDKAGTERVEPGLLNGYAVSGASLPGAVRSEIAMSRLIRIVEKDSETGSLQNMYSRTASVMATMVGR